MILLLFSVLLAATAKVSANFCVSKISDRQQQQQQQLPQEYCTSSLNLHQLRLYGIVYQEKYDIYDLGVILQDIIVGKHINRKDEVDICQHQLERGITAHIAAPNGVVDLEVQNLYTDESLKTVMQICNRCLLEDPANRPSIKNVLWNLQFAAQIQDSSQSNEGFPSSPRTRPQRLQMTVK
ncbi:hypothetical protein AgCh_039149 [Apium graveolens]